MPRLARARTAVAVLTTTSLAPAAALLVPGAASAEGSRVPARASSIIGTWVGDVVVDEGLAEGYRAQVRIRRTAAGTLRGRIAYDVSGSLEGEECTGVWRFKGKRAGTFTFKEVITVDPLDDVTCSTPVAVRVEPTEEGIDVEWRVVKSGAVATMSATTPTGLRAR